MANMCKDCEHYVNNEHWTNMCWWNPPANLVRALGLSNANDMKPARTSPEASCSAFKEKELS